VTGQNLGHNGKVYNVWIANYAEQCDLGITTELGGQLSWTLTLPPQTYLDDVNIKAALDLLVRAPDSRTCLPKAYGRYPSLHLPWERRV
jgi:hypothetical protein